MQKCDYRWVLGLAVAGALVTSAGCDRDRAPTASTTLSASRTTGASTISSLPTCVGPPLKVSLTPVSTQVAGAKATYPVVRVTSVCEGSKGAAALEHAVTETVAVAVADWTEIWQEQHASMPEAGGSFKTTASVPVNVPGLVVVTTEIETYAGGPYPNTELSSVALNTATGKLLTREAMLAEMQGAGGPGWNFERELRRSAVAALPSAADLITDLKRDDVSFYPSKAGLAVSADGYFPHVVGPAHFTIPWPRLVGAGDDLTFVPDAWGY